MQQHKRLPRPEPLEGEPHPNPPAGTGYQANPHHQSQRYLYPFGEFQSPQAGSAAATRMIGTTITAAGRCNDEMLGERLCRLLDAQVQPARRLTALVVTGTTNVVSTSNCFRTRDALFNAIVERFAQRERANWDDLTSQVHPSTPAEFAHALALFARQATGPQRALTLARYAVLVEAAQRPELRPQLSLSGARVNEWFSAWIRVIGSQDPDYDMHVVMNYWTGLVLHQLAIPDPHFEPAGRLSALLECLIPAPGQPERLPVS
jgi:hypothetical protein